MKRRSLAPDVIRLAVGLYFRFTLSLRDVEDMRARPQHRSQPRDRPPLEPAIAQRVLAAHAAVHDNFNVQRRLIRRSALRRLDLAKRSGPIIERVHGVSDWASSDEAPPT
jgi:hypothetical protein